MVLYRLAHDRPGDTMTAAPQTLTTAALKAEIHGLEHWIAAQSAKWAPLSGATRRKLAALKAELATR